MKNKMTFVYIGLAAALLVTGVFVYKAVFAQKSAPVTQTTDEEEDTGLLPPVDESVKVTVTKSKTEADTVVMKATGLDGKMVTVGYELTYDSEGLIKGVNSGSKPIDTAGKDEFERDVYLGTCSRNVCKADKGVTKVSIVLEFTDTAGKKSQFSGDFDL